MPELKFFEALTGTLTPFPDMWHPRLDYSKMEWR